MIMNSLFKNIDTFCWFVKLATEPDPSAALSTTNEPEKQTSISDVEALAKGGEVLMKFMREHGKDMSQQFHGRTFLYDFPGKSGSTCLLDNHIVHFDAKLIPVERETKSDMKTDVDSAVKYIVNWIKRDSSTSDIANDPKAVANLTSNLMGQKGAESSTLNYSFGFIQATQKSKLTSSWKGHVFVIKDYNTKNGVKVDFIWPYISLQTFEDGINFWLDYLKSRGFIDAAKQTGEAFTEALQNGSYFNRPTKEIVDPATGNKKKVVDAEKAKEVRDQYYKNSARYSQQPQVQAAIQKYVF